VLARYDPSDNAMYKYILFGVPRGLAYSYDLQIRREEGKIIFDKELRTDPRVVDLTVKDHSAMSTDFTRNILGHPICWFEGDTLVVDSFTL